MVRSFRVSRWARTGGTHGERTAQEKCPTFPQKGGPSSSRSQTSPQRGDEPAQRGLRLRGAGTVPSRVSAASTRRRLHAARSRAQPSSELRNDEPPGSAIAGSMPTGSFLPAPRRVQHYLENPSTSRAGALRFSTPADSHPENEDASATHAGLHVPRGRPGGLQRATRIASSNVEQTTSAAWARSSLENLRVIGPVLSARGRGSQNRATAVPPETTSAGSRPCPDSLMVSRAPARTLSDDPGTPPPTVIALSLLGSPSSAT
jgi:hypothetical protein